MKIVCDNCATKYQIADEKVSGKAFKIRCKKCGHVIVVNKGTGDGASQAPAAESSVNQEAPPPAAEAAAPSDAVWHLVIDREQVGPMTPDEVKGKVRGGQADAETYGWREGFDDWLKLSAIEDFKVLFAAADDQATRRTDGANRGGAAPSAAAPGADLFTGLAADAPVRTAAAGAATIVSDGMHAPDLAALGLSSPLSDSAPAPMAPAPMSAPAPMAAPMVQTGMDAPVKSMTGARSENSVLFSLNNLSALAGASGGSGKSSAAASAAAMGDRSSMPSPQSEASGLIDIRAMAAAHLGPPGGGMMGSSSRGPDLLAGTDAPPVFTPLAANVLMPTSESNGVPKWVFALVGVGVLMFLGMIVTLVLVLREPAQPPVVTNNPPKDPGTSGTTTNPTKEPGTPSSPNITKEPGTKPSSPDKPDKPDKPSTPEKGSDKPKSGSSGSKKEPKEPKSKETKETKPDKGPDISSPPTKTEPEKPKKVDKPKAKDDLDSLLDNASSGSGGKPKKEDKKDLPEQASMSAIQGVLKKIDLSSCKSEGASGTIMMKLNIKGNGKAEASGSGTGADCVAKQVKKLSFPEFSGDSMSLNYPFIVR